MSQTHPDHDEPPDRSSSHSSANIGDSVYDATGIKIGTVILQNFADGYLIVRRGIFFPREIYVPLVAVAASKEREVHLRYSREMLLDLDWSAPPVPVDIDAAPSLEATIE